MNSEKARDFKKRMLIGRTFSINEAMKGAKRPVKEKVNDDSIIRKNINNDITAGIASGKSKLAVLLELSSKPEYQKYNQYFRQWIDDQYAKKTEIQGREQKEDEQERD